MKTLKSLLVDNGITKVASTEVPKDSMEWNEAILKEFYSEHSDLPKEYKSDAVVNNIDDKAGYAKGSIIMWHGESKINFPIIIKKYELSPFDTFVDSKGKYKNASTYNITKALNGDKVGKVVGKGESSSDIKRPGGITPKESKKRIITGGEYGGYGDSQMKTSFDWKSTMHKADFEKFAMSLADGDATRSQLYTNNPDLITEIINEGTHDRVTPKTHKEENVDATSVIKKQQKDVVTSAEMFNTSMLKPVTETSKVVLRMGARSMEDIMGSGKDMKERFEVASSGVPVSGYVFVRDGYNDVFISECGRYRANGKFYALSQEPLTNELFTLDGKVSDTKFDPTPTEGFDKILSKEYRSCGDFYVIYGAGDSWKIMTVHGANKKIMIEGREAYLSKAKAIIKANVAKPVTVDGTDLPVYRAAIGNRKIVLVPELAIIANTDKFINISGNLLTNTDSIKKTFDKTAIQRIEMSVGSKGVNIYGDMYEEFAKVAGLKGALSARDTSLSLQALGMSKQASNSAINNMLGTASKSITVYGVGSAIDYDGYADRIKTASIKESIKQYAELLKTDLSKEAASIVDDPEAVDSVLSLNFINEDNINGYINNVTDFEDTSNKLSEILTSSRLGLKDVDEESTKKAIEGIDRVVEGLNKLKLVVSE